MQKHFFFDLDNTLTRSRSHLDPAHAPILQQLADRADIIVVTGGVRAQIAKQLDPELAGRYFVLGQNGNSAFMPNGTLLWEQRLSDSQKSAVMTVVRRMRSHLNLTVKDEDDLVEDRGSQISYSLIGHHEDISAKEAFDPDHAKRLALLSAFAADVAKLSAEHDLEIRSGGTTCLDIFEKGRNKGYNCAQLIERLGWQKDECLYLGDALFPGGNDETVIGVIPTHSVKDYHETYAYLSSILV
jgi:phosphomannomutase